MVSIAKNRQRADGNSPRISRKGEASGFSLVEVLVVLLVSGLLALIVANLYFTAARRSLLQGEAVALLTRLEQAKSFTQTQLGSPGPNGTEYRILINPMNCDCYRAEFFNSAASPPAWQPSVAISSQDIPLNRRISFGPRAGVASSPEGQPAGAPVLSTEIRFNSRGFPVGTATNPPTAPQVANAVYLNDGVNTFAVTVNLLGRIQIWAYDQANNTWITVSR